MARKISAASPRTLKVSFIVMSPSCRSYLWYARTKAFRRGGVQKLAIPADFPLRSLSLVYISPSPNGRGRSSGVEHYLAKVRVVSSNLIARSNKTRQLSASQVLSFLYCSRVLSRRDTIAAKRSLPLSDQTRRSGIHWPPSSGWRGAHRGAPFVAGTGAPFIPAFDAVLGTFLEAR